MANRFYYNTKVWFAVKPYFTFELDTHPYNKEKMMRAGAEIT